MIWNPESYDRSTSLADTEDLLALGTGALLLLVGACVAISSAPFLYRGITGRWPAMLDDLVQPDNTRAALGGDGGVHIRESIRLEIPIADVYGYWRRLENLPTFMSHLTRVTNLADGKSHWTASGPAMSRRRVGRRNHQ